MRFARLCVTLVFLLLVGTVPSIAQSPVCIPSSMGYGSGVANWIEVSEGYPGQVSDMSPHLATCGVNAGPLFDFPAPVPTGVVAGAYNNLVYIVDNSYTGLLCGIWFGYYSPGSTSYSVLYPSSSGSCSSLGNTSAHEFGHHLGLTEVDWSCFTLMSPSVGAETYMSPFVECYVADILWTTGVEAIYP